MFDSPLKGEERFNQRNAIQLDPWIIYPLIYLRIYPFVVPEKLYIPGTGLGNRDVIFNNIFKLRSIITNIGDRNYLNNFLNGYVIANWSISYKGKEWGSIKSYETVLKFTLRKCGLSLAELIRQSKEWYLKRSLHIQRSSGKRK